MKMPTGTAVLVACALAAMIFLTATHAWTNDIVVPSGDEYQLINRGSNKCFEPTPQCGHV